MITPVIPVRLDPRRPDQPFPPVELALDNHNGLLAYGGDLSTARLLNAYRHGIYPCYGPGEPILWWSPDPRAVLCPTAVRIHRSLRQTLRSGRFTVSADTAFDAVIAACADTPRPGAPGTWIVPEMQAAYRQLHRIGYAHSIEVWQDGSLAGGLYGVALGGVFFGESMFHCQRDASKVALVALCRYSSACGQVLIDCQLPTAHLASMGVVTLPRREFIAHLQLALNLPAPPERWQLDPRMLQD